jgi:prepilin-type N-terminal cleavage/methylation domain-containing protein
VTERGFTLLELLVAMTIAALLAGAVAGVVGPARASFEATPAALDQQLRRRTGVDALAFAMRSAGASAAAIPAIVPVRAAAGAQPSSASAVLVNAALPNGARGVLGRDQVRPGAALVLSATEPCAGSGDVCGFTVGAAVAIADGLGRYDVFTIRSTSRAQLSLTPTAPLSTAYPAGSLVVEARSDRFELARQADGAQSLVRITAAGATEPMVDGIAALAFEFWDEASAPVLVWDGPWRQGGPTAAYDTDVFRVRRVDVSMRLAALAAAVRGPTGRWFSRGGGATLDPSRWVPDRVVKASVMLRDSR